jgi:hypothetical protein
LGEAINAFQSRYAPPAGKRDEAITDGTPAKQKEAVKAAH